MRIERWLCAAALWAVAGCGGSDGGGGPQDASVPFLGNWSAGGISNDHGQNLVHPWDSTITEFLRLDENGGGYLVLRNFSVDATDRVALSWVRTPSGFLLYVEGIDQELGYDVVTADERTLLLRDAYGAKFEFWRNDVGVPVIDEAHLELRPPVLSTPIHPMSELVAQGSTAWFEIYGHNLVDADGTILVMDEIYSHPVASQAGDFWLSCLPCETPRKLQRRTMANALVSELDLGEQLVEGSIAGAYFDAASLWVLQDDSTGIDTDQHRMLWRFSPATGQPFSHAFYRIGIETFTFHEGRMFAIASFPTQVLLEIDTQEQKALRSMELPGDVRWQGLASMDGELQILGAGLNEYPVIAEVTNL